MVPEKIGGNRSIEREVGILNNTIDWDDAWNEVATYKKGIDLPSGGGSLMR